MVSLTACAKGLRVVWEVPTASVEQDALRWLNDAGVSNIEVRIAP
jgi:hypothetical protein